MSFFKKLRAFFAEETTPEKAVMAFADPSKGEESRRAQVAIVKSLSDRLPKTDAPNAGPLVTSIAGDLLRAAQDPLGWVRATALYGLREVMNVWRYDIGADNIARARDCAESLLHDSDAEVREQALRVLSSLHDVVGDDEDARLVERVSTSIRDTAPNVRRAVVEVLGSWGAMAQPYAASILGFLDDSDGEMRSAAASTIGYLGDASTALTAVEKLTVLLQADPDKNVRAQAGSSLAKFAAISPRPVVAALAQALSDSEESVRHHTIFAIHDLGALALPLLPKLRTLAAAKPEHGEAVQFVVDALAEGATASC